MQMTAGTNKKTSAGRIYTRTGDNGQTSVYGGKRVEKHNQQVVAYGTIDELNSSIGVVIVHLKDINEDVRLLLTKIQRDLFIIGAHLAGSTQSLKAIKIRVKEMERHIDIQSEQLPELKNFILPSGVPSAAFSHLARSICRRAEREIVKLAREHGGVDPGVMIYVNRLSDMLFVLARYLNRKEGKEDEVWKSV